MKKKAPNKLRLQRETLRQLQKRTLKQAVGGTFTEGLVSDCNCPETQTCDFSYCIAC